MGLVLSSSRGKRSFEEAARKAYREKIIEQEIRSAEQHEKLKKNARKKFIDMFGVEPDEIISDGPEVYLIKDTVTISAGMFPEHITFFINRECHTCGEIISSKIECIEDLGEVLSHECRNSNHRYEFILF